MFGGRTPIVKCLLQPCRTRAWPINKTQISVSQPTGSRQFHTVKLAAKAAYLRDVIDYSNPVILVEAYSKASTAMGLAEASWSIDPSYVLTGGLSHYFMSGDIDAYSTRETQNRTSLYVSFIYRRTGLSFQFNLREELVDGDFAPFVLAAGANWSPYTWLEVKGKVSKDYRMPALNELYWMPGGDPKLKPERGWSQEIGLAFTVPAGRSVIKYQLTGFKPHDQRLDSLEYRRRRDVVGRQQYNPGTQPRC